jgi:hypothetical protein
LVGNEIMDNGPNPYSLSRIQIINLPTDAHWFIAKLLYFIKYSAHFFYIEDDAEIFPVHYTWKVAEKGFKKAFMMNKLAIINSCEIILEQKYFFLPKIIVKFRCALYLYAHYTR